MSLEMFRPVLLCCSYVLIIIAVMLSVPAVFALSEPGNLAWFVFPVTVLMCLLIGVFGAWFYRGVMKRIGTTQLYMVTTSCWILFGLLGTVPLLLALPELSAVDAIFESFSGITTTGSTVLSNIETLPRSVLVWRGLLQWVGGIGIVVLSIAVLPFLRIGGMRLFASESSDWSGKSHPKTRSMVYSILLVYVVMSSACAGMYWFFGMSIFDASVHAMSTISTGGFANYDASFRNSGPIA